jgi:hypothetical protein
MRWISNPLNSPKARVLAAALHDSNLKILPICLPAVGSKSRRRLPVFFRLHLATFTTRCK